MKVAFVTPSYYPAVIGASLYCQGLADYLVKHGVNVTVYTNATPDMKKEEIRNGIKIKRFYPKMMGHFYVSKGMLSALLKDKFDVIHSHHYGYYPAFAGFLASKLKKTPHVFGPYYHPPIYGLKRSVLFYGYHVSQGLSVLRYSDIVLPHTEYEKKMLIKVGAKPRKMRLLPNIVDTKKFKPKGKKEKIVLFVNNLIEEKGGHVALDLAESVIKERNDVRFVFIGNIFDKNLLARAKNLSKSRRVIFLNRIPEDTLIKWYQKSLVFILPSRYEAFSRVIAEAQSCGCAIVATKVGGIPEVVDVKSGYLVDYGNWEEMKDKINHLLDNPKKANAMGKQGRRHVVKSFDIDVIGKKLIRVYEEVLR